MEVSTTEKTEQVNLKEVGKDSPSKNDPKGTKKEENNIGNGEMEVDGVEGDGKKSAEKGAEENKQKTDEDKTDGEKDVKTETEGGGDSKSPEKEKEGDKDSKKPQEKARKAPKRMLKIKMKGIPLDRYVRDVKSLYKLINELFAELEVGSPTVKTPTWGDKWLILEMRSLADKEKTIEELNGIVWQDMKLHVLDSPPGNKNMPRSYFDEEVPVTKDNVYSFFLQYHKMPYKHQLEMKTKRTQDALNDFVESLMDTNMRLSNFLMQHQPIVEEAIPSLLIDGYSIDNYFFIDVDKETKEVVVGPKLFSSGTSVVLPVSKCFNIPRPMMQCAEAFARSIPELGLKVYEDGGGEGDVLGVGIQMNYIGQLIMTVNIVRDQAPTEVVFDSKKKITERSQWFAKKMGKTPRDKSEEEGEDEKKDTDGEEKKDESEEKGGEGGEKKDGEGVEKKDGDEGKKKDEEEEKKKDEEEGKKKDEEEGKKKDVDEGKKDGDEGKKDGDEGKKKDTEDDKKKAEESASTEDEKKVENSKMESEESKTSEEKEAKTGEDKEGESAEKKSETEEKESKINEKELKTKLMDFYKKYGNELGVETIYYRFCYYINKKEIGMKNSDFVRVVGPTCLTEHLGGLSFMISPERLWAPASRGFESIISVLIRLGRIAQHTTVITVATDHRYLPLYLSKLAKEVIALGCWNYQSSVSAKRIADSKGCRNVEFFNMMGKLPPEVYRTTPNHVVIIWDNADSNVLNKLLNAGCRNIIEVVTSEKRFNKNLFKRVAGEGSRMMPAVIVPVDTHPHTDRYAIVVKYIQPGMSGLGGKRKKNHPQQGPMPFKRNRPGLFIHNNPPFWQ